MKVVTLGALGYGGHGPGVHCRRRCPPCAQQSLGQLPSSESVNAVLSGIDNGWPKVIGSTLLRAILIVPGMALTGARGWRLVGGSLLSSATITAFLFVFYGVQRR